jgi:hypothetical protein
MAFSSATAARWSILSSNDRKRALTSVGFGYVDRVGWHSPVRSPLDPVTQILKIRLEVCISWPNVVYKQTFRDAVPWVVIRIAASNGMAENRRRSRRPGEPTRCPDVAAGTPSNC